MPNRLLRYRENRHFATPYNERNSGNLHIPRQRHIRVLLHNTTTRSSGNNIGLIVIRLLRRINATNLPRGSLGPKVSTFRIYRRFKSIRETRRTRSARPRATTNLIKRLFRLLLRKARITRSTLHFISGGFANENKNSAFITTLGRQSTRLLFRLSGLIKRKKL